MRIDRLDFVDGISKLEKDISKSTGNFVTNISYWNPGESYQNRMLSVLDLPINVNPIEYIYGYQLTDEYKASVLKNLGVDGVDSTCVIMQSSTAAIALLANFLKCMNNKKVCILQPSYFSVGLCLDSFCLDTHFLNMNLEQGDFTIPVQKILDMGYDVVWITSPVFCVGKYYTNRQIANINKLIKHNIMVICDEALCEPGQELIRVIPPSKYLISFYSPHKVISVNSVKFATIVCDRDYLILLEHLADTFHGGLSASNTVALEHYMSKNYKDCFIEFDKFTKENLCIVKAVLNSMPEIFLLDDTHGQYATIFMPSVPYQKTLSLEFIEGIIRSTNISILPGRTMGFDSGYGFCFRINLTLNPNVLSSSIRKIIQYLSKLK